MNCDVSAVVHAGENDFDFVDGDGNDTAATIMMMPRRRRRRKTPGGDVEITRGEESTEVSGGKPLELREGEPLRDDVEAERVGEIRRRLRHVESEESGVGGSENGEEVVAVVGSVGVGVGVGVGFGVGAEEVELDVGGGDGVGEEVVAAGSQGGKHRLHVAAGDAVDGFDAAGE